MSVAAHPKPLTERINDERAKACRYRALGMEDKAAEADAEVDNLLDAILATRRPLSARG